MKSNASLVYSLVLIIGDFLALIAAFGAAFVLRGLSRVPVAHPIHGSTYIGAFFILLPFWILIFGLLGLYNSSIYEKRFPELGRLVVGSFVGLLFVIGYGYFLRKTIFPAHLVPVYAFGLGFLFLVIFRNTARAARSILFRYDIGITNLLIVGNTKIALELVENLSDYHTSGYRIVGVVTSRQHSTKRYPHIPVFSSFSEALKHLNLSDIHSIVQTELFADADKNNEILTLAQENHIAFRFVPGNTELFVGNIEVDLFRSVPVVAVHQTALLGWGRIIKRAFDVIAASLLLIIASPIMLLSALAIKVGGGSGPIFFRQIRLTRFDQQFSVYKFRTAKSEFNGLTHEQAFAKIGRPELLQKFYENGEYLPNDPRYTFIGRFLRRSSIDELPQLFNVIKGDLSLVGPRALIPEELALYDKKHAILSVKSGLTGLAQVSGRKHISFDERRTLDLYYVQNWSFWMDLVILAKTFRAVLSGDGAR